MQDKVLQRALRAESERDAVKEHLEAVLSGLRKLPDVKTLQQARDMIVWLRNIPDMEDVRQARKAITPAVAAVIRKLNRRGRSA